MELGYWVVHILYNVINVLTASCLSLALSSARNQELDAHGP